MSDLGLPDPPLDVIASYRFPHYNYEADVMEAKLGAAGGPWWLRDDPDSPFDPVGFYAVVDSLRPKPKPESVWMWVALIVACGFAAGVGLAWWLA